MVIFINCSHIICQSIRFADTGLQGSLTRQTTTNLLQNGGFESLEGWTACNGATDALVLSNDAQSGSNAGFLQQAESCFFQSVSVSAGDTVSLSCYAKLVDDSGWTGLGFAFSDVNWQSLENAPENAVRGNVYRQYVTSATAPANTKYASLWVYTGGKVLVDSCQLIAGPPIIPAGNLLLNPSFEDGQEGWFACGDASKINLSTDAAEGSQSIEVKDGGCLYQDLGVLPNFEYKLSCQAKRGATGYATLILSFLDVNWASVKSENVVVNASNFTNFPIPITLKAPANTKYAAVAFYSETPTLYDDCKLAYQAPPLVGSCASADEVVNIPDYSLRSAILTQLNKASGVITCGDMQSLTALSAAHKGVENIEGLQWGINLETIDISSNQIRGISALVANSGLGQGDIVKLADNCLDLGVGSQTESDIAALVARAVNVTYDNQKSACASVSLVKDVNLGSNDSDPILMTAFNNKLYFNANDSVHGRELWEYDINDGTRLIKDINLGNNDSHPRGLIVFNNKLHFGALIGNNSAKLWEYDNKKLLKIMLY